MFKSEKYHFWQGVNGTKSPCPAGFRLPTEPELDAERLSWGTNDVAGAFASPLKLPVAGLRGFNGSLNNVGTIGVYASITVIGIIYRGLFFAPGGIFEVDAEMDSFSRVGGNSVRCIKYYTP